MPVFTTRPLVDAAQSEGWSLLEIVREFETWKAGGPAREHDSLYFGKDSSYATPTVDGQRYVLRHVHLMPLSDAEQLTKWRLNFQRRSRKTSDRSLIYVSDDKGNHLLIFVLPEPDAHAVARMGTQNDKETMEGFAEVAAAFLFDGSIIA